MIRPIDMQIMMPKVTEMAKLSNDLQKHGEATAQQQAKSSEQGVKAAVTTVHQQESANKASVKEKQEKEKKESKKKQNQPGNDTDKHNEDTEDSYNSHDNTIEKQLSANLKQVTYNKKQKKTQPYGTNKLDIKL